MLQFTIEKALKHMPHHIQEQLQTGNAKVNSDRGLTRNRVTENIDRSRSASEKLITRLTKTGWKTCTDTDTRLYRCIKKDMRKSVCQRLCFPDVSCSLTIAYSASLKGKEELCYTHLLWKRERSKRETNNKHENKTFWDTHEKFNNSLCRKIDSVQLLAKPNQTPKLFENDFLFVLIFTFHLSQHSTLEQKN